MESNKTIRSALKDEITCAVCQEIYNKPQALIPCLHTFCLECVNFIPNNDYGSRVLCPICRNRSTSYVANFTIQSFIDIFNNANLRESELVTAITTETDTDTTTIIERINLNDTRPNYGPTIYENGEPSSPSSSYRSIGSEFTPCRSCLEDNNTNYQCPTPITANSQDSSGHILCEYCYEYMPARGQNGIEPAIDQCCSFCGIIACDAYWTCSNRSRNAKLYRLSEISNIPTWLKSIDAIDDLEEGHLNKSEIEELSTYLRQTATSWNEAWKLCLSDIDENIFRTPLITTMTAAAHEVYNTHRLPKYFNSNDSDNAGQENEDSEDEDYFDQIREKGIMPSDYLRACASCLPAIVNGQFYGYMKVLVENGVVSMTKERCVNGIRCETQWRSDTHAERLSHIETSPH